MPGLDPKFLSGLDRGAFQPLLAAGACWLLASDDELSAKKLEGLVVKVFPERIAPDYVRRLAGLLPASGTGSKDSDAEGAAIVQDALLEAGAALRKILVSVRSDVEFREDEDFDADPTYGRAVGLLDQIRHSVEQLDWCNPCQCPHCALVGELQGWFGLRTIDRKPVRQSWCRVCRTLRGSSEE